MILLTLDALKPSSPSFAAITYSHERGAHRVSPAMGDASQPKRWNKNRGGGGGGVLLNDNKEMTTMTKDIEMLLTFLRTVLLSAMRKEYQS